MKPFTTSQRLQQIMDERGMKQVDIVRAARPFCEKYGVNLGKNTLSQYLSGKTEPKQDKLSILGMALGVSEAWLMGYDVPMERNTPVPGEAKDGRIARLVELAKCMAPKDLDEIIAQIEWKLSRK